MSATTESADNNLPSEEAQLLLRRIAELSIKAFAETERPRAALAELGLKNLALLEQYQVGYCDRKLKEILNDEQLQAKLTKLGIFDGKSRERFADHFVFPVIDAQGMIADLWGIPLKTGTARFLPDRPCTFWNTAAAKLSSQIFVVPNPLDGLALKTAGFGNTIALYPSRSRPDIGVLERVGVQRLVIVLGDDDKSTKSGDVLATQLHPYRPGVIVLPKSTGVLTFLKSRGEKALAEAVVAGLNGVVSVTVPGMRPRPDGFSLPLKDILYTVFGLEKTKRSLWAVIRAERGEKKTAQKIDFNELRSRREFLQEFCRVFQEPVDRIEADLGKLQDACDVRVAQPDLLMPDTPLDPVPEGDRREAELMGKDSDLFGIVVRDFRSLGVVGETENIVLSFLVMTSRKMSDPLALMFLSSFGTGKNMIADRARDLCPPEDQFDATQLSGKALYYLPPNGVKHKLITIGEDEGAKHANYPLRSLISAKVLTSVTTARDPVSGRLGTETKRIEGPAAVMMTSSNPSSDRETLSRFIVTHNDESREQTRAIQKEQRKAQTSVCASVAQVFARIYRRHHAYQRLLQNVPVVIPAKIRIEYGDDRLSSRRDYPKILGLIKAIAFARQMKKTVKQIEGISCIEVDGADLAIALPIIRKLFVTSYDELSASSRGLLLALVHMRTKAKEQPKSDEFDDAGRFIFTRRQIREQEKWSNTTLHRCLCELINFEYVLRDTSTRRQPYRYVLDWIPAADSAAIPVKFHVGKPETSTCA